MHPSVTQLSCPRCADGAQRAGHPAPPLYLGEAAGMRLHACGACGGVFLSTQCAQRLAAALPLEAIALAAHASHSAKYQPDQSLPLHCPMCQQVMRRVPVASAGIELDTCGAHGTFYDRYELERIATSLRKAGWGGGAWGAASVGAAGAAVAGAGMAAHGVAPQIQVNQFDAGQAAGLVENVVDGLDVAEIGIAIIGGIFAALTD